MPSAMVEVAYPLKFWVGWGASTRWWGRDALWTTLASVPSWHGGTGLVGDRDQKSFKSRRKLPAIRYGDVPTGRSGFCLGSM